MTALDRMIEEPLPACLQVCDHCGDTLLGSWNTAGYTDEEYEDWSDVAMAAYISKTGVTYFIVASKEQADASAPTGFEYIDFYGSEVADTTSDPRLYIEYNEAGASGNPWYYYAQQ